MKSIVDRKVGTRIAKMLYESQHEHGYIQTKEIERISDQTGEPLNVIQDVVSFFPHYRTTEPPSCTVHFCRDMSCRLRGAAAIGEQLEQWSATHASETTKIEVKGVSCLGRCDRAPAVMIHKRKHVACESNEDRDSDTKLFVAREIGDYIAAAEAVLNGEAVIADSDETTATIALENAAIDCYRQRKSLTPYSAIRGYVKSPIAANVIQALKSAELLGMGGPGGRAAKKWEEVNGASGESKYVVCNADESEPGTFKDRDILLAAPHLVIEGMILAGLVVGAQQGFIYIRHEFLEQVDKLNAAIKEAVNIGACGSNIFGSGRSFQLEVFVSPGGYICGEQTALIEALEGKRSEPRIRPPELQVNGLYDQPTLLSNVETFAWVPAILLSNSGREASDEQPTSEQPTSEQPTLKNSDQKIRALGLWYKDAGRLPYGGKRFFSISGDLNKPGAYEVPCGITLGELIDDFAGGMKNGVALQAVALSGPSGGFLPAWIPKDSLPGEGRKKYPHLLGDSIDVRLLPLAVNAFRDFKLMLGAGIVIYGADADMLDQAIACSSFYQRESCGKCVPCRLGSRKILDLAESLQNPSEWPLNPSLENTVNSLARLMETTSICGLGQVAGNPLKSYLRFFQSQTSISKQ